MSHTGSHLPIKCGKGHVIEHVRRERVDHDVRQVVRPTPKIGRNDACPCRSGKKFKRCCGGLA